MDVDGVSRPFCCRRHLRSQLPGSLWSLVCHPAQGGLQWVVADGMRSEGADGGVGIEEHLGELLEPVRGHIMNVLLQNMGTELVEGKTDNEPSIFEPGAKLVLQRVELNAAVGHAGAAVAHHLGYNEVAIGVGRKSFHISEHASRCCMAETIVGEVEDTGDGNGSTLSGR